MMIPYLTGWPTLVAALLILAVLWIVNRQTIRKYIAVMDK
jgi:hypothetical protein